MKKNIINIVLILTLLLAMYLVYITSFEKIIYAKNDFISKQISNVKDFEVAKYCVQKYLYSSSQYTVNIKYFLRNNDRKKHVEYNKFLNNQQIDIEIVDIKKDFLGVYVVYYTLNSECTDINRIVMKKNVPFNSYKIIYDSLYENIGGI